MTQVRPPSLPAVASDPAAQSRRPELERLAAQFRAAMGGASAQKPAAASPPAVYAQPVQRLADPPAEAPQRILRPGSIVDIRV